MPDLASSHVAPPERVGLPPLILDPSVLLSPFGPLMVQRLSARTSVWLPGGLWDLMHEATTLAEECAMEEDPASVSVLFTTELWRQCWPELVQRPGVHWFRDALNDSHAPKGEPAAMLDRLDSLIASLDSRGGDLDHPERETRFDRLIHDGCRDALALAGMFREGPSIILSAFREGDSEPWICRSLEHYNITGHRIADDRLRQVLVHDLIGGLAVAGLAPLLGSGTVKLAALQLATAKSAIPLPLPRAISDGKLKNFPGDRDPLAPALEEEDVDPFWDHVAAIWHDLS